MNTVSSSTDARTASPRVGASLAAVIAVESTEVASVMGVKPPWTVVFTLTRLSDTGVVDQLPV